MSKVLNCFLLFSLCLRDQSCGLRGEIKAEDDVKFDNDDDHGAHGIDDDHPDVDCDDEN